MDSLMASTQQFQTVLEDLGGQLGLGPLHFADDYSCSLTFDGRIGVDIDYNADTEEATLFSALGPVPDDRRAAFAEEALEANLFWQGTGGATLGVDAASGQAVLAMRFPTDGLDSRELRERIERLVDVASDWRDRIESAAPSEVGNAEWTSV